MCRKPEEGTPRSTNNPSEYLIYSFLGNRMAETLDLQILYSYTENQVIIHEGYFENIEE